MAAATSHSALSNHSDHHQNEHSDPIDTPSQSFSVSVGSDDWAGQVIDNVVGGQDQGSDQEEPETEINCVQNKILEKKKLFHKSRFLELKNLPDGATEKVKHKNNITEWMTGWHFL